MTSTTHSSKSRTIALSHFNKDLLQARRAQAKVRTPNDGDSPWSGVVFGPYLVPLTRRVE